MQIISTAQWVVFSTHFHPQTLLQSSFGEGWGGVEANLMFLFKFNISKLHLFSVPGTHSPSA